MESRGVKYMLSIVSLVAITSAGVSARAQVAGSFSGIVLLDNDEPLAGASVAYNNIPRLDCRPGFGCRYLDPPVSGAVLSDPDGTFTVSNLSAGQYSVCASGPQPNHLRSCVWGQSDTGVGVDPESPPQHVTLNVRTGGLVTFNVSDPSGLIRINDTNGVPAGAAETNLGISVSWHTPNGYDYYATKHVGTAGSQWTYHVAVLIGVPLQLFFSTTAPMQILDQSGQPLPLMVSTGSLQANDTTGVTVFLSVQPSGEQASGAVTNGATFQPGVAPGSIATVFAQGITTITGIIEASSLPLPNEINGTSVSINGEPVPLFAIANVNGQEQVNFQIPSGLMVPGVSVVVSNNGVGPPPISSSVFPALPGIFTVDGSRGAIQHASDFRLVTPTDPAIRGEAVVIYATGLGPVEPDPGPGNPASASPLSITRNIVFASLGGVDAPILFSGLAPGFVGLNQVNIQVPFGSPIGDVDAVLSVVVDHVTYASLPVKISVQ